MSTMERKPSGDNISDAIEALSRERDRLLAAAEKIDAAIATLSGGTGSSPRQSTRPLRYTGKDWIPAARAYLEKIQRPVTKDELVKELVEGGAGFYVQNPKKEANKAINRAVVTPEQKREKYEALKRRGVTPKSPLSIKPASLKKIGDIDMIGLPEWPDEKFKES